MKCEAEGIIEVELPSTMGTTSKGKDFEKREYVLWNNDLYKKMMRFSIISYDGPIEDAPAVGDHVRVKFTVEARESNGRWFNDVKAYRLEKVYQ